MIQLLMIADDFTGALDTGVQFSAEGAVTRLITDPSVDFASVEAEVLVINTESRHLSPKEAYDKVFSIVEAAKAQGIPYIYKKTDSALRGNVGSELAAILDAGGAKQLSFLPAFPKIGRTTENGIQYIEGVPVEDSVFGQDPFSPVCYSHVPTLLGKQWRKPVSVIRSKEDWDLLSEFEGIFVWDSKQDEDLQRIGEVLKANNRLGVLAGCAGMAGHLPALLELTRSKQNSWSLPQNFFVLSGSVNPITLAQLDYAQAQGFYRIQLTAEQKLNPSYWESPQGETALAQIKAELSTHTRCIVDSNDKENNGETTAYAKKNGLSTEEIRVQISRTLGYLLTQLTKEGLNATLMIIGGDTLHQCMTQMGVTEVEPLCELSPGSVLSQFNTRGREQQVISKSGGFGNNTILVELGNMIAASPKKEV